MSVSLGDDGKQILERSMKLAADRYESLNTLHVLLAFTESGGLTGQLITRNHVTAEKIRKALNSKNARNGEATRTIDRVNDAARDLAERLPGQRPVSALHLLHALASVPDTLAYRWLSLEHDTASITAQILGILTGTGRRAFHVDATEGAPLFPDGTLPPRQGGRPAGPPRAGDPPAAHSPARPPHPPRRNVRKLNTTPPVAARPRSPWALDPKRFQVIAGAGANLNELAARGKLDPLIGRRRELEAVMDILGKRRANNPCLVGDPGVGKTAIVEGFASMIVRDQVPDRYRGRVLVKLGASGLMGGTGVRGALGERLMALRAEMERAEGRIILFFDDMHEILKASESGGEGVVQDFKEAMEHGTLPFVCTTTSTDYKKISDSYPGFARCLTVVNVEEPDEETTLNIVGILSEKYASFHNVRIEDGAIHAAVTLTGRYMPGRHNPEKSLAVLDLASARANRGAHKVLDREEVAHAVADTVGVPRERLSETDTTRLLALEEELSRLIVGHREAIDAVANTMRRNAAGFHGRRPIGSFLFLGPTGVGKTEMSKAMARIVFDRPASFVRFDMSEFSESHSVSRLVGAPPGYVGHERGGELTGALMESPYKLILLDEFEKAHPAVHRLLLQILDDGRLTDALGKTVDFSNTIVVMTSNMGSGVKPTSRTGFATEAGDGDRFADYRARVLAVVRDILPPELFNRIDEPIVFSPLDESEIREIAARLLASSARALEEHRGVTLTWNDGLIDHLIECGGYDPGLGARPMKRTIQQVVESRVAELILTGKAASGGRVRVTAKPDRPPRFRVSAGRSRSSAKAKERKGHGTGKGRKSRAA
jgi:ATP-dependent Clp protease ATP-binding subunit ClpC